MADTAAFDLWLSTSFLYQQPFEVFWRLRMAHTRLILGSIKFIQLILSATCLGLHVYSFMNKLYDSHNTMFCGTFMGFTLVSVALFFGYCVRAPAPKGVDFFFGFMGGVSFYVCGLLALYYPMLDEAMADLSNEEESTYKPLNLSCRLGGVCFVTALVYVFEGCLLYDLWYFDEKSKKTVTFTSDVESGKYGKETEDPLGPLALTCCLFELYEACWMKNEKVQKWKKRMRRKKKGNRIIEVEPVTSVSSTLPSFKPISSQSPSQTTAPRPVTPSAGTVVKTAEVKVESKAGPSMHKRK